MKLALLDIKIFRIPLPEPIEAAAAGVMSGFDMVMVRATDDQGATGTGYTVMHQGQGVAVAEIIKNVFHDLLIG